MLGLKRSFRRMRRRREFHQCIRKIDPLRIVVGAGSIFDPGWCPSEIDTLDLLSRRDWVNALGKRKIDAILAEHVWEHLSAEQGTTAARTCFEFLKPGGYLRWAVPDAFHPSEEYREMCRPGGTGAGADDHKVFYNHKTATKMFADVGFVVEMKQYFESNGTFHRADWDPDDGKIHRSAEFDWRNADGELRYTSLFLDARKP
ncbi:MAG: hypothetical protein AAFR34_04750 [Pseudomonadota bacterium]